MGKRRYPGKAQASLTRPFLARPPAFLQGPFRGANKPTGFWGADRLGLCSFLLLEGGFLSLWLAGWLACLSLAAAAAASFVVEEGFREMKGCRKVRGETRDRETEVMFSLRLLFVRLPCACRFGGGLELRLYCTHLAAN